MKRRLAMRLLVLALVSTHPAPPAPGAAQPGLESPPAPGLVAQLPAQATLAPLPVVAAVSTDSGPTPRGLAIPALSGQASWYRTPGHTGAAGPRLRHALGKGWRGRTVTVCRTAETYLACTRVKLTDWCACPHRLIDLSNAAFANLAPLSRGVVQVRIQYRVRVQLPLPATDAAR